ncbi:DUF469 family protein [Aquitalea sp. S1-19]|uniref:DUF469 family protein n=1 Tax=Craterilacuibacter sinensis TaxID=2686017 RepID=A0A845BSF0_9NEIS|nr:YggL family protein [Craterilacuibacter sinensis]MCP9760452.1 DUF469 family protein [Aquitalea sp. S1-19]MXR38068.1 DUF469 family protein [Craterilacuibacter sinensis]RQW26441.1 DUF469 family protein [Rhodobacteraceae bacterium CH30]
MLHNPNSNARLKRLKPRQRKKLRVGEFTELGFSLIVTLKKDTDLGAQDALLDAWLEAVDAQGVSFGGHFAGSETLQFEGIVFPVGRGSVSAETRTALVAWLSARAEVESVDADELADLWNIEW